MRYLLDTNIFIYLTTDPELLSEDVYYALSEPDVELNVSAETVRELIVGFFNKSFDTRFPYYQKQGLELLFNEK